eukprot:11954227-Alexandrium_andersonii.AAC.1
MGRYHVDDPGNEEKGVRCHVEVLVGSPVARPENVAANAGHVTEHIEHRVIRYDGHCGAEQVDRYNVDDLEHIEHGVRCH